MLGAVAGIERKRRAPPRMARKAKPAAVIAQPVAPVHAKPSLGALFEHYGVEAEGDAGPATELVEGVRCLGCGWIVREDEHGCRACGETLEPADENS